MTDQNEERCVLCLDEKRSPVRIQCGHSFCHECLDVYKTYHKYPWANKCPICRGVLKDKKRMSKSRSTSSNDSQHQHNQTRTMDHRETSGSTATLAAEEQTYILEEFIAIATDEDTTPSEWGDVSGMEDIEMDDEDNDDDNDGDEEGNFFTDSDEDSYYYFEEDVESWDQQSSIVNVEDYEPEVVNDSEVIVLTDEGMSESASRLQAYRRDINNESSDSDVVIVDDSNIVVVD